jgi:hydrogenase expression/formation protein HypD
MRVPASRRQSLQRAKAAGADIRMVYSTLDALRIAAAEPQREVVFFAIGFETTTPPTAVAVQQAARLGLGNFSIFCNHVLTPPAMRAILAGGEPAVRLDGFIGPSHVSAVIGTEPYRMVAEEFRKPVVVAGFEPLDVMQALLLLLRQVNSGRAEVENQYIRAVTREGNRRAQALMAEVFTLRESFEWRGLGFLPQSALRLAPAYARFDAELRFGVETPEAADNPACECGAILRGTKRPVACRLFGSVCTPESPVGSCMVSSEGACAAYWTYGRFRAAGKVAS